MTAAAFAPAATSYRVAFFSPMLVKKDEKDAESEALPVVLDEVQECDEFSEAEAHEEDEDERCSCNRRLGVFAADALPTTCPSISATTMPLFLRTIGFFMALYKSRSSKPVSSNRSSPVTMHKYFAVVVV